MFARNIKRRQHIKLTTYFFIFMAFIITGNVCVIKAKRSASQEPNDADADDGGDDGDGNGAKGSHKNAAIYLLIYAQQ